MNRRRTQPQMGPEDRDDRFVHAVRREVERARRGRDLSFWQGLSLVGAVGWVVALPAVVGALLGHWIDVELATGLFWSLSLLTLGLAMGCVAAWRRVLRDLEL